jgi:hypothetical protein
VSVESTLDLKPVDQARQMHQRTTHVDQLSEPVNEQLVGFGAAGLRFVIRLRRKVQGNGSLGCPTLQIAHQQTVKNHRVH